MRLSLLTGQASWLLRGRAFSPYACGAARSRLSHLLPSGSSSNRDDEYSAVNAYPSTGRSISFPDFMYRYEACRHFCDKVRDSPPHQVILFPALYRTMTKGNLPAWGKSEGDKVAAGQVLCLIETGKSTMEIFVAREEGFLAKILVSSGSTDVAVGQPIAIIVKNEEDIAKVKDVATPASAAAPTDKSPKKVVESPDSKGPAIPSRQRLGPSVAPTDKSPKKVVESPDSKGPAIPSRQRLGPSVRKLLIESGIDVTTLKGTGPGGAVVKGDVLAAMKSGSKPAKDTEAKKVEKATQMASLAATSKHLSEALPPPSTISHEDIPTSQIRKVIAKRLLESKNGIPHLYLSADTVLDATLALRKELKDKHGVHVSVNDFVIKAVASALKIVPEANAHWDEKAGDVVLGNPIDISIAVATEKGLMTPILRNADQKSLPDISSEVKLLAGKAREGKLLPHEFQGGTFSISNLGMFAVDHFCAIINPPQACILAVGRGEPSVVWQEHPNDPTRGKPCAMTKMTLTLSADHRVVDTEIGGRFLDALAGIIRDPRKVLL